MKRGFACQADYTCFTEFFADGKAGDSSWEGDLVKDTSTGTQEHYLDGPPYAALFPS
jgi:hypothetical protein